MSHDDLKGGGKDGDHDRECAVPSWSYNITLFFTDVYLVLKEPLAQISSRAENGRVWCLVPPWVRMAKVSKIHNLQVTVCVKVFKRL